MDKENEFWREPPEPEFWRDDGDEKDIIHPEADEEI